MIIAVIKLYWTDPTGDDEEGEMVRSSLFFYISAGSFGYMELNVVSPDVDK